MHLRELAILLALATLSALGIAPAAAHADVGPGDPAAAVVTHAGSELDVFSRTSNNGIDEMSYLVGGGWSGPVELPGTAGTVASGPAGALYQGVEDVYWLGTDAGIDEIADGGSGWGRVAELPATNGTGTSAPAVDVWRSGAETDVYWRNTTGGIQEEYTDGGSWISAGVPAPTNGTATSGPSADIFRGGGQVDNFYRSADNGIDQVYVSGASWSSPYELPSTAGTVTSQPASLPYADGTRLGVFWRGADGGIDEEGCSCSAWAAPVELPGTAGTAASAPGAAVFQGAETIFYQAPDGTLRQIGYTDAFGWSGVLTPVAPSGRASTTAVNPSGRDSKRRLRVKVDVTWHWDQRGTRIRRVRVGRLPRGARVAVTCRGHGCPVHRAHAGRRSLGSGVASSAGSSPRTIAWK